MNNNSFAVRSDVPFGCFTIEGYLLPETLWTDANKFGVSKTQAVILAYPDYDRNQAAKRYIQIIKSNHAQVFVPQGFQVHPKVKTDGAKGDATKVDLLPVDQLIPFLKVCKKLGSAEADDLIDDLAGLSLQQLFSDAFKIKFEQEQRQDWLKDRQEGKQVRLDLTDAIKWYLSNNVMSPSYIHWVYVNCSDIVNQGLFGRKAKKLLIDFKAKDRKHLRDSMTAEELRWLSQIEELAARLIVYQGWEPQSAVIEAVKRCVIPVVKRVA